MLKYLERICDLMSREAYVVQSLLATSYPKNEALIGI